MRKARADLLAASKMAKEPDTGKRKAMANFGAGGKEVAIERRARWAHLRHILTEAWVNGRPMRTIPDIQARLLQASGLEATEGTIERDLNALGAIRIHPEGKPPSDMFYVIPPYIPEAEDLRAKLSGDVIAIETEARISAYVVEMFPMKDMVFINTDRNCGQMVADILSLNAWPEMMHVQASQHSIAIYCPNPEAAETLWLRLNRQYEDVPRYRVVAPVRRRSSGSFLDYFHTYEMSMKDVTEEEVYDDGEDEEPGETGRPGGPE